MSDLMNRTTPMYPNVPPVPLVGLDGNAFSIMGRVAKHMRSGGCTEAQVQAYVSSATGGDYNRLLQVTLMTVPVRRPPEGIDEYLEYTNSIHGLTDLGQVEE